MSVTEARCPILVHASRNPVWRRMRTQPQAHRTVRESRLPIRNATLPDAMTQEQVVQFAVGSTSVWIAPLDRAVQNSV